MLTVSLGRKPDKITIVFQHLKFKALLKTSKFCSALWPETSVDGETAFLRERDGKNKNGHHVEDRLSDFVPYTVQVPAGAGSCRSNSQLLSDVTGTPPRPTNPAH